MCDRSAAPTTTSPSASDAAAPDWSTLDVELRCPRCGYNLRLLPNPRCPECGLSFNWDELIAAARHRLVSPLFDYRWRDRPVRSFLLTCWRSMWPWRLWRDLPLAVEPRLGPLVVLLVLMLVVQILTCAGLQYAVDCYEADILTNRFGRWAIPATFNLRPYVWTAAGDLLLVGLTWVVLQVFQQTAQRYRIRRCQVLRLIILATLGLLLWRLTLQTALNAVADVADATDIWIPPYVSWCITRPPAVAPVLPVMVFFLSLGIGLQTHLRIRRGWAMSLAAAVIIVLLFAAPLPVLVVDGAASGYQRLVSRCWPWLDPVLDWLLCRPQ